MSETTQQLFQLVDELRREIANPDFSTIFQTLRARGIQLTLHDIRALYARMGRSHDETGLYLPPTFITDFIAHYLSSTEGGTLLDPWAGIGAMLMPVVSAMKATRVVGLVQEQDAYQIAKELDNKQVVDWHFGNPLPLLDDLPRQFDVIVSAPPWNWKREPSRHSIETPTGSVDLQDDFGSLLILKSSMLLSSQGYGFFVVAPNFIFGKRNAPHSVFANLHRFGLYLDAALTLPSNSFAPLTALSGLLIIVRRQKPQQLFVGELNSDPQASGVLLKNLKARKEGKTLELGALVDQDEFQSLAQITAARDIARQVKGTGLVASTLSDIVKDTNIIKANQDQHFQDLPNCIYLPLIGYTAAVTSVTPEQERQHLYLQLTLDAEKVVAEYLAHFFNSPLGRRIREATTSGVTIQRVNRKTLLASSVYLPDVGAQAEAVRVSSVITNMTTQLETLRRQLWSHPRRTKEIEKAIERLNREDDLESWIGSLPFPIASILWKYDAVSNPEKKVGHLLHFFEALAEFSATILLSAFASDEAIYRKYCEDWIENDSKHEEWFLKASFGGWNTLGARLAKKTRSLLSGAKEDREMCLELFGYPDSEFMDMMTSKELYALLGKVALEYRNKWTGHGGVLGVAEARRRLSLLEASLAEARRIIADHYSTVLLLLPETCRPRQGVYHYQAKALLGAQQTFKEVAVETLSAMDVDRLYLLHANQYRPVVMLPFLQLMGSPESERNACYFYSSVDGAQARWVSYHFEDVAERNSPTSVVEPALAVLRPINQNRED